MGWTDGLPVHQPIKGTLLDYPVIKFVGTGSEETAVEAIKTGLHDYMLKSPRHFARLPAAVCLALSVGLPHPGIAYDDRCSVLAGDRTGATVAHLPSALYYETAGSRNRHGSLSCVADYRRVWRARSRD